MAFLRTILKSIFGGGTSILLILAVTTALTGVSYIKGRTDQSAQCRTAELTRDLDLERADKARLIEQTQIADQVRKDFAAQILKDIQALDIAQTTAKEFADDINNRENTCDPISPDDAARLLKIN